MPLPPTPSNQRWVGHSNWSRVTSLVTSLKGMLVYEQVFVCSNVGWQFIEKGERLFEHGRWVNITPCDLVKISHCSVTVCCTTCFSARGHTGRGQTCCRGGGQRRTRWGVSKWKTLLSGCLFVCLFVECRHLVSVDNMHCCVCVDNQVAVNN